ALEQRQNGAHRRDRLADVDHHRQVERRGRLLRAPQRLEIVAAHDVLREPRLDAEDDVAVAGDGAACQRYVGARDVDQLAAGDDAGAGDVDKGTADLRR